MKEIKEYLEISRKIIDGAPALRDFVGEELWNCKNMNEVMILQTRKFQANRKQRENETFWSRIKKCFEKKVVYDPKDSKERMKKLLDKFSQDLIAELK